MQYICEMYNINFIILKIANNVFSLITRNVLVYVKNIICTKIQENRFRQNMLHLNIFLQ